VLESTVELKTLPPATGRRSDCCFEIAASVEDSAEDDAAWTTLYEVPRVPSAAEPFLIVSRAEERVRLRFVGSADFLTDLTANRVRCIPIHDAPDAALEALFVDQVFPRVSYLRARPMLHASAVQIPDTGNVLAFLGPAGSGKSTLCAALVRDGARAVCDDCFCVRLEETIRVLPSYPSVRIWPDAADALFGGAALPAASPWSEKRRVEGTPPHGPVVLRAAVFLETRTGPAEIVPVDAREAFRSFIEFVHRLELGLQPCLDAEFKLLTGLAERVPAARLYLPRRFEELPRALDLIRGYAGSA
jgi:hypothetical protein